MFLIQTQNYTDSLNTTRVRKLLYLNTNCLKYLAQNQLTEWLYTVSWQIMR